MSMMSEEEKKAIKILQEEHDVMINPKLEAKYTSDEVIEALYNVIMLVRRQQKEIEDYKKFKKDIVNKIMIWDKEELPDNEVVIGMIDTLMEEVSRLEDIEDKKVQVAVDFIEEKRDKYWKEKIRELREIDNIDLIQFKIKELLEEK